MEQLSLILFCIHLVCNVLAFNLGSDAASIKSCNCIKCREQTFVYRCSQFMKPMIASPDSLTYKDIITSELISGSLCFKPSMIVSPDSLSYKDIIAYELISQTTGR